jgi:hypothetical protein
MTAGMISLVLRIGSLDSASCLTVAKCDCDSIFCLQGMDKLSEEMELDTNRLLDETTMMLGSGDKFRTAGLEQ